MHGNNADIWRGPNAILIFAIVEDIFCVLTPLHAHPPFAIPRPEMAHPLKSHLKPP